MRRVWELQNVSTKSFQDLQNASAEDVLNEIRSHRNRHHNAALSWLNLYLTKVESKEEADSVVPAVLMEYQASGMKLPESTAGALSTMAVRVESDVALQIFCDSTRFRVWPQPASVARLLRMYSAKGDAEAARLLWNMSKEKGLVPTSQWYQYLFRAYVKSSDPTPSALWTIANAGMQSGLVDTTGMNLLLKICLKDSKKPDEAVLSSAKPNASTEALLAEINAPVVDDAAAAAEPSTVESKD